MESKVYPYKVKIEVKYKLYIPACEKGKELFAAQDNWEGVRLGEPVF
jgi:hypothetical protein